MADRSTAVEPACLSLRTLLMNTTVQRAPLRQYSNPSTLPEVPQLEDDDEVPEIKQEES